MFHKNADHKKKAYLLLVLFLPAMSAVFLYLEHVTHFEFLLHVAAIPLEILLGAFLVERYLAWNEKKAKLRQLMFIKSYIFRSNMKNVFISNFRALEEPRITCEGIKNGSLEDLHRIKQSLQHLKYTSAEEMEAIIEAYTQSHRVFHKFMEWAIENNFENIFHDMIFILHFIQDVNLFKMQNPDKPFIGEAERRPELMAKVYKILGDGLHKFMDYAIELKEKQPDVFEELLTDYQLAAQMAAGPMPESHRREEVGETSRAVSFPGPG